MQRFYYVLICGTFHINNSANDTFSKFRIPYNTKALVEKFTTQLTNPNPNLKFST